MARKLLSGFSLVFFLFSLLGALQGRARAADTVKVCYIPVVSVSPMFLAIENGYFKREGIDPQLKVVWPTDIRVNAVIQGNLDICTLGFGAALVNAIQQGAPLRIVSDMAQQKDGWVYVYWMVRKDLYESGALRKYANFKGRTFGMSTLKGSIDDYILARALRAGGLTRADIHLKKVGYNQMPAALRSKAVDVAYMIEPFKTIAEKQGVGTVLAPSTDVAPEGTQQAILFSNQDFITKRTDVGRRFMRAYLDGAKDHVAALGEGKNKERLFEVIDKWTKVNKQMASQVGYPFISLDGRLNEKATMSQLAYLHDIGVIDQKVKRIEEIVDYRLLP
ncbi:MAG: ABC transporter substrate-binding protein [Nitrospinota bacterium]